MGNRLLQKGQAMTTPDHTLAARLAPCPFCGGEATLIEGDECAYVQCLQVKNHRGPFVDGDNAAADEAVTAWNTRTTAEADARVKAAVLAEREACAMEADATANWIRGASDIAAAIRARGVTG